VAVYEDPAAAAVNPVVGNPARMRMRWAVPAAGNPNVASTVPALVTIDPDESALWRWGTALDDGSGWADANHDLRKRRCRGETKGKK